jgi:mono/diheme cytochrome c family protein
MKLGRPAAVLALVLAASAVAVACDRPPSADNLQEWKPADHDQELSGGGANGQQAPPPKSAAGGGASGQPSVVDLTWQQGCASCHGMGGRGDGPSGPMVNAPDLTQPAIQDKFSDDDLVDVIANGRNKMPKFGLSDGVVKGLVAKVRSLRGH